MQFIDFITKILKPLIDQYDYYHSINEMDVLKELMVIYDESCLEDLYYEPTLTERIWIDEWFKQDPAYFISSIYYRWKDGRNPTTLYIWIRDNKYSLVKYAIDRLYNRKHK